MRITEKNTPILKFLKWKKSLYEHKDFQPGYLNFLEPHYEDIKANRFKDMVVVSRKFVTEWPTFREYFSNEIDIVSEPFMDAMLKNAEKLWDPNLLSMFKGKPVSGTLIWGKHTICYFIEGKDDLQYEGEVIALYDGKVDYMINTNGEFTSKKSEETFSNWDTKPGVYYTGIPMLFHLFKRYADVETVDAKPFKKVPVPNEPKETLMVDSELPVKYYDCSWFRTIVRKEGFLVRGHMRLQPYKNENGEWDRKLRYIEPYQKHGYTRTAKKVVKQRKGE